MPWYLPWPESIMKRACRYLLQRYLGQFLEEKLTLDQLTVDLYKGTGSVSEVRLDVEALNELGAQQNWPVQFVDGYVSGMCVSVPWASLLSDSSYVEVTGLCLTVQPKKRDDSGASMLESMWSSMSSSMQLAEECLKEQCLQGEAEPLQGLEMFAQAIDSILCRVKVKFVDMLVRVEHMPKASSSGVAIEIRIKNIDYLDEAGMDPPEPPASDAARLFHVPAFSTKKFCLEGVSLFTDEFPAHARTFCRSVDTSADSSPDGKTGAGTDPGWEARPVLCGKLAGRQELRVRLRQGEGVAGPKVDLELTLGAFTAFLSPRQLHAVLEMARGLAQPDTQDTSNVPGRARGGEKPMRAADFQRVEQELQNQLTVPLGAQGVGLQLAKGWSSASLEDSDEEFLPMQTALGDSVLSTATSLDGSVSSSVSSASSDLKTARPLAAQAANLSAPDHRKKKHRDGAQTELAADVTRSRVRLASVAVVLLHEDVLTVCAGGDGASLATSSVRQMQAAAQRFFLQLGLGPLGGKDFAASRPRFQAACALNHIRLLAAPVVLEASERTCQATRFISGCVTVARLELLECLDDQGRVELVELLRFSDPPLGTPPDLKLHFKYAEKSVRRAHKRLFCQPRSDISLDLAPCWLELDVSVVDRVSALLNPPSLCRRTGAAPPGPASQQALFHEAVESQTPDARVEVKATASQVSLKLRFPTPDLRPKHNMDRLPWWRRCVRKDYLTLQLHDCSFCTAGEGTAAPTRYELQCRHVDAHFQEADTDAPVRFLSASCDDAGWPRLVVVVRPAALPGALEEDPAPERGDALLRSMSEPLERASRREPSPFGSKKVVHKSDTPHGKAAGGEGEEQVVPGDRQEMQQFMEHASQNCRVQLEVNLPSASMLLPSKHLYEIIYNRINTDMFLWEPSAPKPVDTPGAGPSLLQDSLYAPYSAFGMCRSGIQYDSDDSGSEDGAGDGAYYSVYEHRERQRRKQLEGRPSCGQSKVAISLSVGRGVMRLYAPVRDSAGKVIPGQLGQAELLLEEGSLFSVSCYNGRPALGYVCLQAAHASLYHAGLVPAPSETPELWEGGGGPSAHLQPVIYPSERGARIGKAALDADTLSVAIQIRADESTHNIKTFRVAAGLRGSTLRHRMCVSSHSWFTQLLDFFDVMDYPVAGYDPPGVITELHLHFWDCAIDYRPLHLPLRSCLTLGSFSVTSNIAAQTSSSTLRFIAEDVALFLSERAGPRRRAVDLRDDYVCVLDLGLFELSLRLSDAPRADLRASNDALHLRTCADSARALADLLAYFSADGDLGGAERARSASAGSETGGADPGSLGHVHDLMEEAMRETHGSAAPHEAGEQGEGVEVFFFPDENSRPAPSFDEDDEDSESDFCFIEKEVGLGRPRKNGLPEVRALGSEPVRIVDNHFFTPAGKTDLLQAPRHYPPPVLRYTLREMTLVWHMYGGSDFSRAPKKVCVEDKPRPGTNSCPSSPPFNNLHLQRSPSDTHVSGFGGCVTFSKTTPSEVRLETRRSAGGRVEAGAWQSRGGPCRQHDVLMELQLNKVRFQHEVYPEHRREASRQVLLVGEVEVRDRLASSRINKLLYQYVSEAHPRQSHASMLVVKAVHVRPDPRLAAQECSLKVSLLPLRLNVDQDSLLFLVTFFSQLSAVPARLERAGSQQGTPTHQPPVMLVNVEGREAEPAPEPESLLILLEEESGRTPPPTWAPRSADMPPQPPVYFRSFVFSPEVPVRLDYHGKRVDMAHGPLAGLLLGLAQLNCSELRLKRICHRHGLLGINKLGSFALAEWLQDIKKNQLPSLLGGVGPMHALVQLFQGLRDLFWLPIEQYQKDGRIVRGLQRGASSFTTSTAMAAIELTSRLVHAIQLTAEMAYDMVSPGPSARQRARGVKGRRRYQQPADIREGMANALQVFREGLDETTQTLVRVASEEHDQKGVSGAVGGVLRQIPPAVVKPILLATEATSSVLGGMRSQLVPGARREAVDKWRAAQ
ncbi:autophagy-related protein 2 homolog A [Bacillus rossius redtenbacheri]|uniref:autophagy-related protein 2 homolog A n=1 Tax=Bacillus rossius redtenbacheri TaxID=93214 RepID=UPI002FDCB479